MVHTTSLNITRLKFLPYLRLPVIVNRQNIFVIVHGRRKNNRAVKRPEHVHSVHSNKGWCFISPLHGCHVCGIEPKLTYFWSPALTTITNDSNSYTSLRFRKRMAKAYIKEVLKYATLTNTKCNSWNVLQYVKVNTWNGFRCFREEYNTAQCKQKQDPHSLNLLCNSFFLSSLILNSYVYSSQV